MKELVKKIVNSTSVVHDCLLYECEVGESEIIFDRVMSMYGDRTGYEVACNEIRLDKDFLSKDKYDDFCAELDKELVAKFSRKVVVYLLELEDSLEVRFHSLREDEDFWLSEELDEYEMPIVRHISEKSFLD